MARTQYGNPGCHFNPKLLPLENWHSQRLGPQAEPLCRWQGALRAQVTRQVVGHLCMQRTTHFHLFKTLTHFSLFVLAVAPVSGSLRPEIHSFSQGWGAKLEGTGHFGAECSLGCLERMAQTQSRPVVTAPLCVPQGRNMAKLASAFQPVLVHSLESTWFPLSWEIRQEQICLSRCNLSNGCRGHRSVFRA